MRSRKYKTDTKKQYLAEKNAGGSEEYQYGRQYKNDAKRFYITDSLYLTNFSQDGLLSYIPMLKRTEEWKTRDHFYGHPGGYPIEEIVEPHGGPEPVQQWQDREWALVLREGSFPFISE